MEEVVWTAVFVMVACAGTLIAKRARSTAWTVAGIAYAVGGIGLAPYEILAPEPPSDGTALDIAVGLAMVGWFAIFVGMVATLVALGRGGRRRFLAFFGAVTLAIGTYQFWTANWPARFGDTATRCSEEGFALHPAVVQRIPPGLQCHDSNARAFVPADGLAWVALVGWSLFYGFIATFPVMGLAWVISRRPRGRALPATSNT
jgi:hypothetical protein